MVFNSKSYNAWNYLPHDIVDCTSLSSFRRIIEIMYFSACLLVEALLAHPTVQWCVMSYNHSIIIIVVCYSFSPAVVGATQLLN